MGGITEKRMNVVSNRRRPSISQMLLHAQCYCVHSAIACTVLQMLLLHAQCYTIMLMRAQCYRYCCCKYNIHTLLQTCLECFNEDIHCFDLSRRRFMTIDNLV